ncbi:MAG: GH25 family lysozyme [Anaerovoracaceae bacterium]
MSIENKRRKKAKRRTTKYRITKKTVIILIITVLILFILSKGVSLALEYSKVNDPPKDNLPYPVRGVDISHYQGKVDWNTLSKNEISFAFIKATEGSGHLDKNFQKNWDEAHKTNLKIGAYHFMSFETSGEEQAKNFIKHVKKEKGMLPPVVDVEYYGKFIGKPPERNVIYSTLDPLLEKLEREYNQKPIIYVNTAMYKKYIQGRYDNDIWLADLSAPESLPDGKNWEFLQYSFKGKLKGYSGYLPHLDLNAYNGSKLDFITKY